MPDGGLPALEGAYADEPDPALRALIVEAAWQHREASSVGFLAVALRDPDPEVRRRAIDGLVMVATPEARRVVEEARDREGGDEEYRG